MLKMVYLNILKFYLSIQRSISDLLPDELRNKPRALPKCSLWFKLCFVITNLQPTNCIPQASIHIYLSATIILTENFGSIHLLNKLKQALAANRTLDRYKTLKQLLAKSSWASIYQSLTSASTCSSCNFKFIFALFVYAQCAMDIDERRDWSVGRKFCVLYLANFICSLCMRLMEFLWIFGAVCVCARQIAFKCAQRNIYTPLAGRPTNSPRGIDSLQSAPR